MATKKMMLTPKMANKMLLKNTKNRKMKKAYVTKLSNTILRGEWKHNHQPIIFDKDGKLADGQHRLAAIIKSGKSCACTVVTNASNSILSTLDVGIVRNNGDFLSINGEEHGALLASSAKMLYSYHENNMANVQGGVGALSPTQVTKVIEDNPDIRDSVEFAYNARKELRGIISPSVCATMHYILHAIDDALATKFFKDMQTGADLELGNPILALRNVLMRKSYRIPRHKFLLMFKAWNLVVQNKTIRYLNIKEGDKMPILQCPA